MQIVLNQPWLFAILLVLLLALSIELGYRTSLLTTVHEDENRKEQIIAVRDALFLLLSLLLGFTLALAVPRYDHRRELILKEANAIGTTYLRAGTIAEPYRSNAERLLREYVDARLEFAAAGYNWDDIMRAVAHSKEIQNKLWANTVALTQTDRSPIATAFMNSVNETIDIDGERLAAGENRIPVTVWLLIVLVAAIALYTRGLTLKNRFWMTLALAPITVAIVVGLVADLDSARGGMIRNDQRPLLRLKADIQQPSTTR